MSNEKHTVVGFDGLVEFGQYLMSLHGTDYTFEMEDISGRLADCSLDEVITGYKTFFDCGAERFRVRISYQDHRAGMMGYTDKEFRRTKQ
jgi:hypothetical protein